MTNIHSKFNVNLNINDKSYVDCRAFYLKNGKIQRVGGDEFNNCECLTETEVETVTLSLNIPFSSLKTEEEIQPKTPQPIDFAEGGTYGL